MSIFGIIDGSNTLDEIVSVNSTLLVEKVDDGVKIFDYNGTDITKTISDFLSNDEVKLVNDVINFGGTIDELFELINICNSLLGSHTVEIGYDFK